MEDTEVDGRIILKWTLKKYCGSGYGPLTGSFEHTKRTFEFHETMGTSS
jgi:hypothetical protein